MRFIAIVFLLACGKDKAEPKHAPQNVQVTVDGAPLAIDRAFIKRVAPDVYTVLVGSGKGSCESLIAGTNDGTGKTFSFNVQKRVAPLGHESFVVTDLWSRDFDATAPFDVKVKLAGNADKNTTTAIELAAIQGKSFSASGSITAQGCGEVAPAGTGVPKVEHRSKGTILIAGKKLAVKNVTVQVRQGAAAADLPNIVISTGPRDCSGVQLPAPVIIERVDGKWFLSGTWLETKIEGTETAELTFSANMAGKSEDGPTVNLQLSGKGKFGDYTVELFGTVEAIECV